MDGTIGTTGYVANEMYDRINYGSGNNGGGLYTGNSVLAAEAHANGTAEMTAIECGKDLQGAQLDRISAQNLESRANDRSVLNIKAVSDAEFRSLDRQRDIERTMADNAKDAALCCCKLESEMAKGFGAAALKACEDKNDLSKQMAEGFSNIKDRELNAANSRITQLETINALSDHHHRG